MEKRLIAPIAVTALLATVAGCTSAVNNASPNATSSPSASASGSSASSPNAPQLRAVHNPRKVTYSITVTTCHTLPGPRPDPACTPGSFDPSVTQANIATTICAHGYTAGVRPSSSQTDTAKKSLYLAYGIPSTTKSELDHLVSLELGGSNDVTNLWPEVGSIPNAKDKIENELNDAVCSGKVTLAAAQNAIAADWTTAEHVLGLS